MLSLVATGGAWVDILHDSIANSPIISAYKLFYFYNLIAFNIYNK